MFFPKNPENERKNPVNDEQTPVDFIDSIDPEYVETDFRKILDPRIADNEATKFLVMYNGETGKIFVDERAPEWYKKLAALHEEICQKKIHQELIPELSDDSMRCARIERFILSKLQAFMRFEYARARKKMFEFLIDNKLAAPDMLPTFQNSIEAVSNDS